MKFILPTILLLLALAVPVSAAEQTAPTVPDSGETFMPEDTSSFGSALIELFQKAIVAVRPDLREAGSLCLGVFGIVLLVSLTQRFPG